MPVPYSFLYKKITLVGVIGLLFFHFKRSAVEKSRIQRS